MPDTSSWTVHTESSTEAFTGKISPDGRTYAMVFSDNTWYEREKTNTVWAQSKSYIHTAENITFSDSDMTITFDYNTAANNAKTLLEAGTLQDVCPNWIDQLKNAIQGAFNEGSAYVNLQPSTYFVNSAGSLVGFGHYKKLGLEEQFDMGELTSTFDLWDLNETGNRNGRQLLEQGLRLEDSWNNNSLTELHASLGL
jgi:hypothetical protein